MKKIFMLLLMAVAAVSAWGQEDDEQHNTNNISLRQKYVDFLLFPEGNDSLPKLWNAFFRKEEFSIFDEEHGIVAVVKLLPKDKVAEEYSYYLLSLQKIITSKVDYAYNNGLFDCCLTAAGNGATYHVVKL